MAGSGGVDSGPRAGRTACRGRGLTGGDGCAYRKADPATSGVAACPHGAIRSGWAVPAPYLESPVTKRTFQPNNRRRAKTHGFRLRMRTRAGRAVLSARRRKGRARVSV